MSAINPEQLADQLAIMKADILSKAAISPRILDQYRDMIELHRKCFDDERGLWEQERHQLNQYIACLERSLTLCKADSINKYNNPEKPYVSTGAEVWLGTVGQSSSKAAKSFQVSPLNASKPEKELGSIEGSGPSKTPKAPFVMGTGISVPGEGRERDFDGINFKENIRAPPIAESLKASQSATPHLSQSPPRGIPPKGSKPSSSLAGLPGQPTTIPEHKPSGGQTVIMWARSAMSTSLATPTRTDPERLSREPHPSAAKLPSERANEHSPLLVSDKDSGDLELKGPLGLKNNNLEDKGFLRELDSKLLEAANARKADEADKSKRQDSEDDVGFHDPQPEPDLEVEPELQLKPSMNFGSPFGAPYCGKGI